MKRKEIKLLLVVFTCHPGIGHYSLSPLSERRRKSGIYATNRRRKQNKFILCGLIFMQFSPRNEISLVGMELGRERRRKFVSLAIHKPNHKVVEKIEEPQTWVGESTTGKQKDTPFSESLLGVEKVG